VFGSGRDVSCASVIGKRIDEARIDDDARIDELMNCPGADNSRMLRLAA
jgi:hypothetical protein